MIMNDGRRRKLSALWVLILVLGVGVLIANGQTVSGTLRWSGHRRKRCGCSECHGHGPKQGNRLGANSSEFE